MLLLSIAVMLVVSGSNSDNESCDKGNKINNNNRIHTISLYEHAFLYSEFNGALPRYRIVRDAAACQCYKLSILAAITAIALTIAIVTIRNKTRSEASPKRTRAFKGRTRLAGRTLFFKRPEMFGFSAICQHYSQPIAADADAASKQHRVSGSSVVRARSFYGTIA